MSRVGVKVLHLTTGAPIIAKCSITHMGSEYELEDPLYIVYDAQSREDDKPGEGSFRVNDLLILSADDKITIDKAHVLFRYDPSASLLDHYNEILLNKFTAMGTDE